MRFDAWLTLSIRFSAGFNGGLAANRNVGGALWCKGDASALDADGSSNTGLRQVKPNRPES